MIESQLSGLTTRLTEPLIQTRSIRNESKPHECADWVIMTLEGNQNLTDWAKVILIRE